MNEEVPIGGCAHVRSAGGGQCPVGLVELNQSDWALAAAGTAHMSAVANRNFFIHISLC